MLKAQTGTNSTLGRPPKWRELHRILRQEIVSGKRSSGTAIPGQNQLAVEYDVSVNTVREAIAALAHEGLLVRMQGKKTVVGSIVPPSGGVALDVFALARPHSTQPNGTIQVFAGISKAIREFGAAMRMHDVQFPDNGSSTQLVDPIAETCQGALIIQDASQVVQHICLQSNIRYVLVDGHETRRPYPQATYDRRETGVIATEHMYQLGHRLIAMIGTDNGVATEMHRHVGFLEVIRKHALDLPGGFLVECEKSFSIIREATRKLLSRNPRPTCICCTTDRIASAALTVLLEEGISVPDEIALISFTDSAESAEESVAISGVYQPFEEIGYESAKLLWKILHNEPIPEMPIVIPTRVVVRQSCGGDPNNPTS